MLFADDHSSDNPTPVTRRFPSKWPFILGDAALVLMAMAVWFSTDGLSTAQMFFCLGSIVLGAVIFVTPYVLENILPATNHDFTRGNDESNSTAASTGEGEWRRQARAAAEAIEHAARANAALENSARRFDARFAPLVEIHQNLATVVTELREAAAARSGETADESLAIQREFERLRKDQAEKFKAAEEKMAVLGEALAKLAGQIKPHSTDAVQAPVHAKQSKSVTVQESSPGRVEAPVLAGVGAVEADSASRVAVPITAGSAAEVSSPPQATGPIVHQTEAPMADANSLSAPVVSQPQAADAVLSEGKSMLAKALARAQSSGQTPAVAGIIMARSRRSRKTKPPLPDSTVVVTVPETTGSASIPSTDNPPNTAEQEGWQSLAGEKSVVEDILSPTDVMSQVVTEPERAKIERPATSDTNSAFRHSARAKAIALRGEDNETHQTDTPVVFTPGRPEDAATQPDSGPTQGELLAREAETIRKRRSSRSPVQASALTARVLIGIGNKPFVRGTGPGLSAEKGVPMEFVEIGQWRWVAPGAVKEPITLRILKNDETPAEGNPIVLHPGQSLDVSPVFPG